MERLLKSIALMLLLAPFASSLLFSQTPSDEKIYFYHTDVVGSPLAMTDRSGNVVWRADYMPFGDERDVTPGIDNSRRFSGKEKDNETGLSYFGARFYEPKIARFNTTDLVGPVDLASGKIDEKILLNPQRINPVAYSLNNPYRFVDPDGKDPRDLVNQEGRQSAVENGIRSYEEHKVDVLGEFSGQFLEKVGKKYFVRDLKGRFTTKTKYYKMAAKSAAAISMGYQNLVGIQDLRQENYAEAMKDFWGVIPYSVFVDMAFESVTGEPIDFQYVLDFWVERASERLNAEPSSQWGEDPDWDF